MLKKLCAVLVAVAVLVTVAVFAWPETVPKLAQPAPQAERAPKPQPVAPPAKRLAVQPKYARQQVARSADVASPAAVASPAPQQQQPAKDPAQLEAQREAKWRAYKTVRAQGRVQRLQQALELAKREGRASDVAALEKQLGREQARIKLLTAQSAQP